MYVVSVNDDATLLIAFLSRPSSSYLYRGIQKKPFSDASLFIDWCMSRRCKGKLNQRFGVLTPRFTVASVLGGKIRFIRYWQKEQRATRKNTLHGIHLSSRFIDANLLMAISLEDE